MQKVNAYQCHSKQALKKKIKELREHGRHPFSVAASLEDADDWHGDPTYLLDPPIGYSTRPADAIKRYLSHYNVVEVTQ